MADTPFKRPKKDPPDIMAAWATYYKTKEAAIAEYRKTLAQILGTGDRIEIYLLNWQARVPPAKSWELAEPNVPENYFPALSFKELVPIVDRKMLEGPEMKRLLSRLQVNLAEQDPGMGARCHYPAHGIRVWRGEDLLFRNTICFQCSNIYVDVMGEQDLVGLTDPTLQDVMLAHLPIPEGGFKAEG